MPSFLNADDIIEISEKRLEQYTQSYQKTTDKFTNIFIIYSAISIFLFPCINTLFFTTPQPWEFHVCFYLFSVLFFISTIFTILLLIPAEVAYLVEPKVYYTDLLQQYISKGITGQEAEKYLKGSYISELEQAIETNDKLFKKKSKYYYRALLFVLMAALPYLVCLAFHFSKDNKTQKIEIVNPKE